MYETEVNPGQQIPPANQLRYGLLALLFTGVIYVVSLLIRGRMPDPGTDPAAFAQFLANPVKIGSAAAYIISLLLHCFGVLTIYAYLQPHLQQSALFGMIFSLTGLMLTLPLIGPLVLVLPAVGQHYLQGQEALMTIAVA
jgi:hypothetical protein